MYGRRWTAGRMLAAGLWALGLSACGASVPVWGPEDTPAAADAEEVDGPDGTDEAEAAPPITDPKGLATALKADPSLRVVPGVPAVGEPPVGLDPGHLVELPAQGVAADPEVLHAWLVDLGVAHVQIEQLLPEAAPDAPRFRGDGEPGVLRLRLRRATRP